METEQVVQVLEAMAVKLGTTTEYLWGILVKQAYVCATYTLLQIILVVICGFVLYSLHQKFLKEDEDRNCLYDVGEGLAIGLPMVIAAIVWAIFVVASFICIGDLNGHISRHFTEGPDTS